jgi:hypothetical protein
MKIIEFYNKGAQVVVESAGTDMSHSFTAGIAEEQQIGYVPAGKAKPVDGAAHDTIEHDGKSYLLLRGGYVYDVKLRIGDVVKEDVVSAEHGHLALPLPAGATVDSATESGE